MEIESKWDLVPYGLAGLFTLLFSGCMTATSTASLAKVPQAPTPATLPIAYSTSLTLSEAHGGRSQTGIRTNPDPLPCDRVIRNFTWTPNTPVSILRAFLWIGTTWAGQDGARAGRSFDVWTTLQVQRDGLVIAFLGLDHYTDAPATRPRS